MKQLIIKKQHSEGCCIKGTESLHFCFLRLYYGNFVGKIDKRPGWNWHRWLEFRCNDHHCDGLWIISENAVINLIKDNL